MKGREDSFGGASCVWSGGIGSKARIEWPVFSGKVSRRALSGRGAMFWIRVSNEVVSSSI